MSGLGTGIGKASLPNSPLLNRMFSDQMSSMSNTSLPTATGAPFEDLRRRLATINGSASSLNLAQTTPRSTLSPILPPHSSALASGAISPSETETLELGRPASPTESVVSTSNTNNSTSFRPLSRMQIGAGGSVNAESSGSQKAAPAIGSSKTNALGLLDTHTHAHHQWHLRSDMDSSPERSGRTTPMSMSQTIRAPPLNRPRVSSMLPISTYGGWIDPLTNK